MLLGASPTNLDWNYALCTPISEFLANDKAYNFLRISRRQRRDQQFCGHVISIRVSDKAGSSSDTATVVLDDKEGQIVLPEAGARISIMLGFEGDGVGIVFDGIVDEVRSSGTRGGGMTVSVSAKGFDSKGKAK